jgi:hypothetical protein
MHPLWRGVAWILAAPLALALGGCGSAPAVRPPLQEKFDSEETYSRLIPGSATRSCEAARRALLSQGYILVNTKPDLIDAKKNFQPTPEAQQEMMIRVVCLPDTPPEQWSLVFVTAIKDTYALKKSASSASVGLGGIGSVSLPFSSTNEALVKVGSETVSLETFYDSFFDLVRRYLADDTQAP